MRYRVISVGLTAALLLGPAAILPRSALAQAPVVLPPEARSEFGQGLVAAEVQAWPVAVKHFKAAVEKLQYSNPYYPPLWFNLGLAHDKAGHELAAIASFWRYLGTAPDADNAAAVRKQIALLKARAEAKIIKLLDAAYQINVEGRHPLSDNLEHTHARFGDKSSASKVPSKGDHDNVELSYFAGAAARGDFDEAQGVLHALGQQKDRDCGWLELLNHAGRLGDWENQRKAIESANFRLSFSDSCRVHNHHQGWKHGVDFLIARDELTRAEKWIDRHADRNSRRDALTALARAHLNANDVDSAFRVLKQVSIIPGLGVGGDLRDIAVLYLAAGRGQDARSAAAAWRQSRGSEFSKAEEAAIQAILGNDSAARKTAASAPEQQGFEQVLLLQMLTGRTEEASRTREAAKRNLPYVNLANSVQFAASDYRARLLLWQGKSAAGALGVCGEHGCRHETLARIVEAAIERHDQGTATEAAARAMASYESKASTQLMLARSHFAAGRIEEGRKAFKNAIGVFPRHYDKKELSRFAEGLAQMHASLGDTKAAASAVMRVSVYWVWDVLEQIPVDLAEDLKEGQRRANADARKYPNPPASVAWTWVDALNMLIGVEKVVDRRLARVNARQ